MGVVAKLKWAITSLASRSDDAEHPAVDAGPQRVLVVDDDQHVLDVAQALFAAEGYLPILISSPQSTLQVARSMRPSVIFLDVLMPGFDGWDVLSALKADAMTSDIPVVMISMLGERSRAQRAGAAGVIPKPLDAAKLRSAMASIAAPRRRAVVQDGLR